jgi:hypothetical protein
MLDTFNNSQLLLDATNTLRRTTDMNPNGTPPTLIDIWGLLVEIRDRLEVVERMQLTQSTAFPIDDLKQPDYAGHRRSHVEMIKADQLMDTYKSDATKEIIKLVVVFVVGLITSGLLVKIMPLVK